MNTAQTIYEKLNSGEELTDLELRVGLEHFRKLADLAFEAGPVFRLTFLEASRVYRRLVDFRDEWHRK